MTIASVLVRITAIYLGNLYSTNSEALPGPGVIAICHYHHLITAWYCHLFVKNRWRVLA